MKRSGSEEKEKRKRTRIICIAVVDIGYLADLLLVVGIVELDVDDGEIEQIVAVVLDDVGELLRITLLQTRNKQNKEGIALLG